MDLFFRHKVQSKYKVSLFALGAVLITYLIYTFLLLPQWTRLDALTAQYNIERQRVKTIEAFSQAHPIPEQHLLALDSKIMQLNNMLPDNLGISSFLLQMEQLSRECGVQLNYLKPTKNINKEGYQEIGVEISLTGNFPQIMDFLSKTENGSRFINITNIAMQLRKNGLTSKLSAKIYSFGSPVAPAANGKVSTVTK